MSLVQFLIAVDQLANATLGGFADETLSARAHRTGSRWQRVIDAMFFWQPRHCYRAYREEFERRQLPSVYSNPKGLI